MEYSPIVTPAQSAGERPALLFAAAGLIAVGATLFLTACRDGSQEKCILLARFSVSVNQEKVILQIV